MGRYSKVRCSRVTCRWVASTFSWYLFILSTGILICTGFYTAGISKAHGDIADISDIIPDGEDAALKVNSAIEWSILVIWLLVGITLVGSLISILLKYVTAAKRDRFRDGTANAKRGRGGLTGTRVLLDLLLVLVTLTTAVTAALVALLVLLIAALKVISVGSKEAVKVLTKGLALATSASSQLSDTVALATNELPGLISTLQSACNLVSGGCPSGAQKALDALTDLYGAAEKAEAAVASSRAACGAGCLDLSLFFFLDSDKCVCNFQDLVDLGDAADEGLIGCREAIIAIAVSFLLWLLFLSKTAMDVKSLLKDAHWMSKMVDLEQSRAADASAQKGSHGNTALEGAAFGGPAALPPHTYSPPFTGGDPRAFEALDMDREGSTGGRLEDTAASPKAALPPPARAFVSTEGGAPNATGVAGDGAFGNGHGAAIKPQVPVKEDGTAILPLSAGVQEVTPRPFAAAGDAGVLPSAPSVHEDDGASAVAPSAHPLV